jgi:hypothetical protein
MSYGSVALPRSARLRLAARLRSRIRVHLALIAAGVTFAVAWGVLVATHTATPLVLSKRAAVQAALRDRPTARLLASVHWNRVEATAMDRHYEILGFYRGGRMVASVTVAYNRRPIVHDFQNLTTKPYMYGANIANDPRVLALLCLVFVLVTGVWPLWRVRNLDVLAIASLTLTVILFNRGLLATMAVVGYPVLAYLALRCAWRGLGPGRHESAAPTVPLYQRLTRRWSAAQRLRTLRLVAVTAAVVLALVGLTSPGVLDVGYAVLEGATGIIHGVLPYGHIPDVLHGDTYPIGSYLFYVPLAWLAPVHNVWDSANASLVVAVVAALLVAFGTWRLTRSHPAKSVGAGDGEAQTSGLRAAIAWMTFPPLLVTVSTGTTDVALAALLVAVLLLWRRPGWSAAALSAAAWFKLVPLALVPLLLSRLRGRALGQASAAIVAISAGMAGCLVALGGLPAPARMVTAMAFQFSRGSQHTVWAVIGSVPLQQLVEAATIALIVGAAIRLRRDPALAADRARTAAVAGAALLGLQVAANYWNYMYLVWVFPFLAVSLLGEGRRLPRAAAPFTAPAPSIPTGR